MAAKFYTTYDKLTRIRSSHISCMTIRQSIATNRTIRGEALPMYWVVAHVRGEEYNVAGPFHTKQEAMTWIKENFG